MKAQVQQRARIARVRRVQHMQASAAAAAAEGQLVQLEMSAERLATLRDSLTSAPGFSSGAALSNAGELAMRLDQARHGLTDAIVSARAAAARRAEERLEARRRQEGAEKLGERAVAALQEMIERRLSAIRPARPGYALAGDDE